MTGMTSMTIHSGRWQAALPGPAVRVQELVLLDVEASLIQLMDHLPGHHQLALGEEEESLLRIELGCRLGRVHVLPRFCPFRNLSFMGCC